VFLVAVQRATEQADSLFWGPYHVLMLRTL
jgi:hypothetical protein